ncbi:hypothetical protein [Burkholderia multivorans]|uniref:hypothetical protein n=1 Tax=Burkholderia multivorans TaxID=87883 RepID=UPI001C243B9B|nr:hypothetical protein [Burkholderia multivorans]MBU9366704.1 hypothetical protein [Burkholderia multivorans]
MNRWKKLSCARRLGCWDVEDSAAATFRTALLLRPQASGQAFLESTKRLHNRQMFEKESTEINAGAAAPASADAVSTLVSTVRGNFLTPYARREWPDGTFPASRFPDRFPRKPPIWRSSGAGTHSTGTHGKRTPDKVEGLVRTAEVRSQVRTGNALFAGAASGASWSFFPPKRWAPEKWQLQWLRISGNVISDFG